MSRKWIIYFVVDAQAVSQIIQFKSYILAIPLSNGEKYN